MMKIWGMLSSDDEIMGFDLVLDDEWYVLLLKESEVIARFDPRDYVAAELKNEVGILVQEMRRDQLTN